MLVLCDMLLERLVSGGIVGWGDEVPVMVWLVGGEVSCAELDVDIPVDAEKEVVELEIGYGAVDEKTLVLDTPLLFPPDVDAVVERVDLDIEEPVEIMIDDRLDIEVL